MGRLCAALLLACLALQSILSMRLLSATSDETTHLPSGYTYLATGQERLNPQHPPLVKLLAGLPLLALGPKLNLEDPAWTSEPPDEWSFGYNFLYSNDADRLLFWGRLPVVLLTLLLGVYVFLWARDLFGTSAGVLALFLLAFCPNVIAHSHLVTMDAPLAAFGFACIYHLWRFTREGTRWHLIGAGLGLGFALSTKFSAILFLPAIVLLLALSLSKGLSLSKTLSLSKGLISSKGSSKTLSLPNGLSLPKALGIILAIASLLTWALYFFPIDPLFYWKGIASVNTDHDPTYRHYLMGHFKAGGWWYYFLLAFLFKTPVPTLILLVVAVVMVVRGRHAAWLDEAFLLAPASIFFVLTSAAADNLGIRYILPVFPFLFVFVSRVVSPFPARIVARAGLAILCLSYLGSAVVTYPDHLAYFNELVGGPSHGHDYLDDSNIDWGQDLKRLKTYVDEHRIERIRLLYAWNASPDYYGIPYEAVRKRDWEVEPEPGTYAISTMWLIHGRDTERRRGVKTDWLSRYRPIGRVGYSFFIFRIEGTRTSDAPH